MYLGCGRFLGFGLFVFWTLEEILLKYLGKTRESGSLKRWHSGIWVKILSVLKGITFLFVFLGRLVG